MTTETNLKQWQRRTEWPLAAVALVFLGVYSVQVLTQPHGDESHVLWAVTWAIWGLFILDYIARLYLAPDTLRWFFRHLFDLAIVMLPLLRPLRLLRLVLLIETVHRAVGHAFRGRIVTASLATWIIQRVSETETANRAATSAHIDELRDEIRKLREELRGMTGTAR